MVLIIILLIIATVNGDIKMIFYDKPGSYQLNPKDYEHANEIIVELWSAGGGGSSRCYMCMGDYGGGGGSYIKAKILTKLLNFNVVIGKGGKGGDGTNKNLGQNGTSTSIISFDKSISLIAGGGYGVIISGWNNQELTKGDGGKIISMSGAEIYENVSGQNGNVGYCTGQIPWGSCTGCRCGNGGTAAMGGFGAINYPNVYGNPGINPGGGGSGNFPGIDQYTTCFGWGGDGGNGSVIIYFSPN